MFRLVRNTVSHLFSRRDGWIELSRLRTILDDAHLGIAVLDSSLRFVEANQALETMLERTIDELRVLRPDDVTHPDDISPDGRRRPQSELRFLRPDGSVVWANVSVVYVRGRRGETKWVLALIEDVTARRDAAQATEEARRSLEAAQAIGQIGSWMAVRDDARGQAVITWSREMSRIFGLPAEVAERSTHDFYTQVHPDDVHAVRGAVEEAHRKGGKAAFEHRIVRPDGSIRWVTWRAEVERTGAGTRTLGVLQDVTDQRTAEHALRLSEEQLRTVFEFSQMGIRIIDLEGRVIRASPAFQRMVGYDEEELRRRYWWEYTHPDDLEENLALWEGVYDGRSDHYSLETRYVCRDGRVIWAQMLTSLVRDSAGAPRFLIVMDVESTERKRLEDQLGQSRKMEAIGRLAGGVAHDFNNLLTAILGCAHLMLRGLPADSPQRVDAEQIAEAAQRASALTSQLLAFGRRQTLNPRVLDLNDVVGRTAGMLSRLLGPQVDLTLDLAPDLGAIRADPAQMDQVVMNLALNARDAMPSGGRLSITTTNVDRNDEAVASRHGVAADRSYILLRVEDDGFGMDETTKARLFEPFFTTKVETGTGLGLATVYGIVEQSGGHIDVTSQPGQGATFEVLLPRIEERPVAEADDLPAADTSASGTILLVEDELQIRRLAGRILAECGYEVVEASNAAEALALAADHDGVIDLLLTDVRMPGESGAELARRLMEVRPTTRILFMSGYAHDAVDGEPGLRAGLPFLEKPFTPDRLERAVRNALAGAA